MIAFQELYESLNNPYPYQMKTAVYGEWCIIDPGAESEFVWVVIITGTNMRREIQFGSKPKRAIDGARNPFELANYDYRQSVGNPMRLFATIKDMIVKHYRDSEGFSFECKTADRTKLALYNRFANMIASEFSMRVSKDTYRSDTVWEIDRPNS